MSSTISATGAFIPATALSSAEVEKRSFPDHAPGWIERLTGVRERRVAAPGTLSSELSVGAIRDALTRRGLEPANIDCLLLGAITHDMAEPATSHIVQDALGSRANCFDIKNACNGFLAALEVGDSFIRNHTYECIAIACGEVVSPFVPWHLAKQSNNLIEHLGALTLGDGAGAIILEPGPADSGIRAIGWATDSSLWRAATVPGAGTLHPHQGEHTYFLSHETDLWAAAAELIPPLLEDVLARAGWSMADVDLFVPHQASTRLIEKLLVLIDRSMDSVVVTLEEFGNMAAASIPVALHTAEQQGRLERGMRVLLVGGAAGFSVCAVAIEW